MTRIASGAEQDKIEKKKKQLHFLYLLEEIDGPTDYHYFSQPSRFFAQSNKANDRETTTVQCATTLYMPWLHKKMPFYIYSKTCHLLHSTVRTLKYNAHYISG
jgi:hypothetical protein